MGRHSPPLPTFVEVQHEKETYTKQALQSSASLSSSPSPIFKHNRQCESFNESSGVTNDKETKQEIANAETRQKISLCQHCGKAYLHLKAHELKCQRRSRT
jgi:hypothetical protein